MTTAAPPKPCRKCGSADRQIVPRVFKDGTHHLDEVCAGCRKHFRFISRSQGRQPLSIAESVAPTPPTPAAEPFAGERFMAAANMLDSVAARVKELLHEMNTQPPDEVKTLALYSCALSAAAAVSGQNLDSLARAIQAGRLPRKRTA